MLLVLSLYTAYTAYHIFLLHLQRCVLSFLSACYTTLCISVYIWLLPLFLPIRSRYALIPSFLNFCLLYTFPLQGSYGILLYCSYILCIRPCSLSCILIFPFRTYYAVIVFVIYIFVGLEIPFLSHRPFICR